MLLFKKIYYFYQIIIRVTVVLPGKVIYICDILCTNIWYILHMIALII